MANSHVGDRSKVFVRLSQDIVNVESGAIVLGQPIGTAETVVTTRLVHSMRRDGFDWSIVTLCIGGGEDIAFALETIV
ncbi:hypothetical protein [Paraburkholderia sediminicola]|uniref:hypothetical protein n=1 Tax=Paraburkholderia sediminicola TaxID=458836 RepID=UPI0038BB8D42